MARGGDNITANDVEHELRARIDTLVPKLLSKAVKESKYWSVGNVDNAPGGQMKINRTGKVGCWTDFSETPGSDRHSGDLLKLIAIIHFHGWSDKASRGKAIAWAKSWLGWDDLSPDRIAKAKRESRAAAEQAEKDAEEEAAQRRSSAQSIWKGAVPIGGTAAEAYLLGRLPGFEAMGRWPGSLRFLPNCWCPVRRGKHPALIACIMALGAPKPIGVHRTYLDPSTKLRTSSGAVHGPVTVFKLPPDAKGRRKSHKLSLGPYAGGCIPLWKGAHRHTLRDIPAGTPVYVSEGIEDGLTIALARPDARVVAGVALSNMGGLILPPQAGELIFIGQRDPVDGRAVEAFEHAIARQQAQAAAQRRPMPRVIWPEPGFKDFNDQLRGIRMEVMA